MAKKRSLSESLEITRARQDAIKIADLEVRLAHANEAIAKASAPAPVAPPAPPPPPPPSVREQLDALRAVDRLGAAQYALEHARELAAEANARRDAARAERAATRAAQAPAAAYAPTDHTPGGPNALRVIAGAQ